MSRALPLALALLMTAVAGCRAPAPQVDRDADEVRVSLDEAERAFLYSAVGRQGLLRLRRGPADADEPARLYAYRQDTRELVEVSASDLAASGPDGQALISVSVQEHAACLNLWDWIEGDVERLDLRLDGLSARPAEPPSAGGKAFDLVFTAREGALFPLCPERDFELFGARIAVDAQGAAALLGVRQFTHNRWDDGQPAFSPDGHWIVYVSDDGGEYVLWQDGTEQDVSVSGRFGHFAFVVTRPDRAAIHLTGAYGPGFELEKPVAFEIAVQRDQPPSVAILRRERKLTMLAKEAAAFGLRYVAEDDFGVSLSLWPEGIPQAALGSRRFTGVAQTTRIQSR